MAEDKPTVLLVHGMGIHPVNTMKEEFVRGCDEVLKNFSAHKKNSIQDYIEVVEINYDKFFNEMRKIMADSTKPVSERLGSIGALSDLDIGSEFVLRLKGLESSFGDQEFFYTHFLDLIFYAGVLGGKVRVDVGKHIADAIASSPNSDIHLIGHSLGTAVVHDTLALLYRAEFDSTDAIPDLSMIDHRLKSIWTISNVSRWMNRITNMVDVYKSVGKPGPNGCVDYFYNVRHDLDMISWPDKFDPKNDGAWVSSEEYEMSYKLIETSVINMMDVHDFYGYISNPNVAIRMFQRFFDFEGTPAEVEIVMEAHRKSDVSGAYLALKESLEDVQLSDAASIKKFASSIIHFKKVVDALQTELDSISG